MLTLKNISKKFNDRDVLRDVSAEFNGGMHVILGPSGSGKSTLLKILSGVDKQYEGDVSIGGRELKNFSEDEVNNYYYNTVGFVWQDFKLIEHLTAEENIRLALELSDLTEPQKKEKVKTTLKKLSIHSIANKKVSSLSGGQKQRVAIARAIIKDPAVIIADEPTGALDRKTSEGIINIFKKISKEKIVIIVTHDKTLVNEESHCYELKSLQLTKVTDGNQGGKKNMIIQKKKPKLSLKGALKIGSTNFKGLTMKFVSLAIILSISSYLLVLNLTNSVTNENEQIINQLIQSRGDSLKDISVVTGAIGGVGTAGSNQSTSIDMEQDISGLFDVYKNDERIEHVVVETDLNGMNLTIDGLLDEYKIERSNYQSFPGPLVAGRMPKVDGKEVAVTKLFLERAGLTPEDVLGKKMDLKTTVLDHDGSKYFMLENYTEREIKIDDIEIVGVIDSTDKVVSPNGDVWFNEVEDGFYFSVQIAKRIKGIENENEMSFTMRVKNIEDVLPITEELSHRGITAFGEFKQIADLLMMNDKTADQSSSVSIVIGALAIAVILITTIIHAVLRKNEITVFRINGYSKQSIFKISMVEHLMISIVSAILLVLLFPFITKTTGSVMNIVASNETLIIGVFISLGLGVMMAILSSLIYGNMKIENNLSGSKR